MIRDAPLKFMNNDQSNILLLPILEHIKYLGKPIQNQGISYFSEEDQMDVYVGIEGVNIGHDATISLEELGDVNKPKLTLNIKPQQDMQAPAQIGGISASTSKQPQNTPMNTKSASNVPESAEKVEETQNFAVSLPPLNTESQFDHAVQDITVPIKRERTKKSDMVQQKKVSNIVFL